MITKVQTIEQLKQLFLEILLNKTDKLSDISDNSILNATAFGVSKVAQKALKDIAIVESHIFPDSAVGSYLDNAATLFGVSERRDANGSSTYLRIAGEAGTIYPYLTTLFTNFNGIQFELTEDFVIPTGGWGYAKVRSIGVGVNTNVEPNSIITVSPEPTGHIACVNEYQAIGGLDQETDELFRLRIKKHLNILSRGTLEYLGEVAREFNDDVLMFINRGMNDDGAKELAVVLQNGQDLTESELSDLLDSMSPYFPISDINRFGDTIGINLVNPTWQEIDIDFRVEIGANYDTDEVRKSIQSNLTKLLDFRFWTRGSKVEWDDLLQAIKDTKGVKYVSDTNFSPRVDVQVPITSLPRIRGFIMRSLDGSIIVDNNNVLLPIFYTV